MFPCPRSPLRIWFREMGLVVPSRVSLLILNIQDESGAYSRDSSRFPRRRPFIFIAILRQRVSPEFIGLRNLRTGNIHCRESVGTGPVILKVV